MDITKNDAIGENVVTACDCSLSVTRGRYFTHLLTVKMSYKSLNSDNCKIAELIETHYELISDDNKDVYKITDGYADEEGGGGYGYTIKDLEFYKVEVVNNKIYVIYKMVLTHKTVWSA